MTAQQVDGVVTVSDAELDVLLYVREFQEWYAKLSEPVRRTLARLPEDARLLAVDRVVQYRLIHDIGNNLHASRPQSSDNLTLVAA